VSICRSTKILRYLVTAVIRKPKLAFAVVLSVLAALAGTMTYAGFLVIGALADYLGTGRAITGLLLGGLFARFPWIRNGKPRIVGLLPKPARRPLMVSLLALCSLYFLSRAEYVSMLFTCFATAFVLIYPWARKVIFDRMLSSVSRFAGRNPSRSADDTLIVGEIREKEE
jgi:peptidoglycan/LPS O-acetylase OafA/YrhL